MSSTVERLESWNDHGYEAGTAAMVVRGPHTHGTEFITQPSAELQVGTITRHKGEMIKEHKHLHEGHEVITVLIGKVIVSVNGKCVELIQGESILLMEGWHSVEFVEDSTLLEARCGPYINDKVYRE